MCNIFFKKNRQGTPKRSFIIAWNEKDSREKGEIINKPD